MGELAELYTSRTIRGGAREIRIVKGHSSDSLLEPSTLEGQQLARHERVDGRGFSARRCGRRQKEADGLSSFRQVQHSRKPVERGGVLPLQIYTKPVRKYHNMYYHILCIFTAILSSLVKVRLPTCRAVKVKYVAQVSGESYIVYISITCALLRRRMMLKNIHCVSPIQSLSNWIKCCHW